MTTQATTQGTVSEIAARLRATAEEHERRMREDPAYRAQQETLEAERRAAERAEREREDRQRRERIEKLRLKKGIPEKFWSFLDAYRADRSVAELPPPVARAHAWTSRFLAGAREWTFLFLMGPPGVGKSAEAAWFLDRPVTRHEPLDVFSGATREVEHEVSGLFVTAAELAKASTYAGEFWQGVSSTPRLVIDDLGVEQLDGKGQALSNLAHLLYHRHSHELRTVITLNMTRASFLERYAAHDGGRLRDRLTESAWFVELAGPSLRRPLALEDTSP